jgi:hypothetical protein
LGEGRHAEGANGEDEVQVSRNGGGSLESAFLFFSLQEKGGEMLAGDKEISRLCHHFHFQEAFHPLFSHFNLFNVDLMAHSTCSFSLSLPSASFQ